MVIFYFSWDSEYGHVGIRSTHPCMQSTNKALLKILNLKKKKKKTQNKKTF